MPFFSVIIPLYNKEQFITNTLKSVLNQTFTDFEVIIVNDGSTDKSLEKIAEFTDHRIQIYHQDNQGVSTARNKGIELAKAEYIAFLDADDIWKENLLYEFYFFINKYPKNKVFSAAIEIETPYKKFPPIYNITNEIEKNVFLENYFKASILESILCTSCAVFHCSVFHKVGVFDTTIKSGQDIDLWIRIGVEYSILFVNKILTTYVYDEHSLSRNLNYKTIKLKYNKFEADESRNPFLKKFLDLNRYSEALSNKLLGNQSNYNLLKNQIDINNLTLKKKILLHLPKSILYLLIKSQPLLIKIGLRKTVFK